MSTTLFINHCIYKVIKSKTIKNYSLVICLSYYQTIHVIYPIQIYSVLTAFCHSVCIGSIVFQFDFHR